MEDEQLVGNAKEPTPMKDRLAAKAIKIFKLAKKSWLLLSMVTAIIMGIIIGLLLRLRDEPYTTREVMYANFLGSLFINVLRAITIPLFVCSVISALGSLDMKLFGKIGTRAMIFFVTTSFFSAALGMALVVLMNPGGVGFTEEQKKKFAKDYPPSLAIDGLLDFLRNVVPDNIVGACLTVSGTVLIRPDIRKLEREGKPIPKSISEWDFRYNNTDSPNYVGLVTICMLFGIVMGYKGNKVKSLLTVISSINEIFMKLTYFVIVISPVPVLCLVLAEVLRIEDWEQTMHQMALYVLCNMIGMAIIVVIVFPVLYVAIIRKSPLRYMYNNLEAFTTALVTASSIATLPVTLKCVETKNMMDKRISRFVIPLGATVNMNGAALYTVVGPMFVAQLHAVPLNAGQYFGTIMMAAIASVGAAGVPAGAIVEMLMVLSFLNAPLSSIGVVIAMDWFVDRWVTAVNITGDTMACAIVQHLSRKELEEDAKED